MQRLRPYRASLAAEARRQMSYRVDFWIQALAAFATELAVAVCLWNAVFAESGSEQIGGFTKRGMILYYVAALLLGKLVKGQERLSGLADDVYYGHLNKYQLYPASYLGMKYAEQLGTLVPVLVQTALFGGVAFVVSGAELSFLALLATLGAVLVGNCLSFLLAYPIQGVAFWADNVWSLGAMLRFITALLGGAMLPLEVFPELAQRVLWWLPFRLLFHFPASCILGRASASEIAASLALGLLWCAICWLLGRAVWRQGEKRYTGVGI